MQDCEKTELLRMEVQKSIDGAGGRQEKNESGQFATPRELALQIMQSAARKITLAQEIRFLDPGVGTGSFYSALLSTFPWERIEHSRGYEIDHNIAAAAEKLWSRTGLQVLNQDFTRADIPESEERFNLIICNPPYVRHHHLTADQKAYMKQRLHSQGQMELNGLAGLYAYFMGLAHPWMAPRALAGWLIPSEFMDVNYGEGVKRYLTDRVQLLHIHRFDPQQSQFNDALVSSAVVWFINREPYDDQEVRMTFGGTLEQPAIQAEIPIQTLRQERKWSRFPENPVTAAAHGNTLSELFDIKRGIATGNNGFFVVSEQKAEQKNLPGFALKPILPGARKIPSNIVTADQQGLPQLSEKLFLLDCDLDESMIAERHPSLAQYLREGQGMGVPEQYLPKHRKPWYSQEKRPPPPFLCTYMGRNHKDRSGPFKFILNQSQATALNVFLLMYPKGHLETLLEGNEELTVAIWEILNNIRPSDLAKEGRIYGGGLRKLEPRELGRVESPALAELLGN